MAKSKTKQRGAAPGAPRPKIEPKRPPFLKRNPWAKWAVIGAVALGILFGILAILGNVSRANALRDYDQALFDAQRGFLLHLEPGAETSIEAAHAGFEAGEVTPEGLRELAEVWEAAFTDARDRVRALGSEVSPVTAPRELIEANTLIAQGIDGFVGVARLYALAADMRERALDAANASIRAGIQVDLAGLLQRIQEARQRALETHGAGAVAVEALRDAWGVEADHQVRPGGPTDLPFDLDGLDGLDGFDPEGFDPEGFDPGGFDPPPGG